MFPMNIDYFISLLHDLLPFFILFLVMLLPLYLPRLIRDSKLKRNIRNITIITTSIIMLALFFYEPLILTISIFGLPLIIFIYLFWKYFKSDNKLMISGLMLYMSIVIVIWHFIMDGLDSRTMDLGTAVMIGTLGLEGFLGLFLSHILFIPSFVIKMKEKNRKQPFDVSEKKKLLTVMILTLLAFWVFVYVVLF